MLDLQDMRKEYKVAELNEQIFMHQANKIL